MNNIIREIDLKLIFSQKIMLTKGAKILDIFPETEKTFKLCVEINDRLPLNESYTIHVFATNQQLNYFEMKYIKSVKDAFSRNLSWHFYYTKEVVP